MYIMNWIFMKEESLKKLVKYFLNFVFMIVFFLYDVEVLMCC